MQYDNEFPTLEQTKKIKQPKHKQRISNSASESEISTFSNQKKPKSKDSIKLNIKELICERKVEKKTAKEEIKPVYSGNQLDSSLPVRKRGKQREIPKEKRPTKLKQALIHERKNEEDETGKNKTSEIDFFNYNHLLTEAINETALIFLRRIVQLQEKLYNKDPQKGKIKKRYFVGFHEAKKYLKLNKVKLLVVAGDLKMTKDGALYETVKELKKLSENKVLFVFASKRRILGSVTLKFVPVSCVGVLSYEGAENLYKDVENSLSFMQQKYNELFEEKKTEDSLDLNRIVSALKCRD